eukprot:4967368-Pyramimonas_sp.AAC.1
MAVARPDHTSELCERAARWYVDPSAPRALVGGKSCVAESTGGGEEGGGGAADNRKSSEQMEEEEGRRQRLYCETLATVITPPRDVGPRPWGEQSA